MKTIEAMFELGVTDPATGAESTWRVYVDGTPSRPGRFGGPPDRWEEPEAAEVDNFRGCVDLRSGEALDVDAFRARFGVSEETLYREGAAAIDGVLDAARLAAADAAAGEV